MSFAVLLFVVASPALAGSVFGDASDEMELDLDGNWPRAFLDHQRNGFFLFSAGGGDFKLTHATSELRVDHFDDRLLTGRKDLKDHDIRPCPDGTWLHVSTGDTKSDHDSAWSWRYDADFAIAGHATIAEASTDGSNFVDVPVVCGPEFQGFAYPFPPATVPARFASLGDDASLVESVDLMYGPFATGASLVNDSDGTLWILGGYTDEGLPATRFIAAQYSTDWEVGIRRVLSVAPDGYEAYWAQTTIRVGGVFIVAHMMRDLAGNWTQQDGNLTLSAFDATTWELVDQVQLSQNVAPNGGMQPFVMFDEEDRLVALYSKQLHNYAFIVELQPEVLASLEDTGSTDTGGDSGTPDTAADTGTGDTDGTGGNPDDTGGKPDDCACGGGSGAAAPALVGVALLALRRRGRSAV